MAKQNSNVRFSVLVTEKESEKLKEMRKLFHDGGFRSELSYAEKIAEVLGLSVRFMNHTDLHLLMVNQVHLVEVRVLGKDPAISGGIISCGVEELLNDKFGE